MDRLTPSQLRGSALAALILAPSLACARVTPVEPELPIQVQAKPPAPPLADLPPVDQPPPPARVTLEDEVLVLDETLTFDDEGQLASGHEDILDEVAKWLDQNGEVTELSVEAYSIGEGNKRAHKKRSEALAEQIVAALSERGVDPDRLALVAAGKSDHDHVHIVLRVSGRAESTGMVIEAQ